MIGADAIVKCLEREGVTTLFGYPGVAICPFFNSILNTKIESILVRSEQNAAHAASGYARVTGKVGVCVATSGPGATNLITGIATAYADSIPLVCITGQVDSKLLGSDVFQEADITGAAESFVKYSYLIKDATDIPRIMKEAFHIASTGRKGPVLIDVPIDIQNSQISGFKYPESVNMRTYKPTVKGHAVQLKKVNIELEKSKKPLICAGGGVILSGAQKDLCDFSHKYGIPVVSTMMGIGSMAGDDPLYFGMIGNNGKSYANRAMQESDLLIVIGARIADRAVSSPDLVAKDTVLIHIDVDPAEIGKNVGPTIPIVGDIKNIFQDLKKQTAECDFSDWINTLNKYKASEKPRKSPRRSYVDPAKFIATLSDLLDDKAVYVADVGQNQMWSCGYYKAKSGWFLTSGGMGTMGYSIPAAIGAKKANMKTQVVAVCGDGSFQMAMNELATMKQHNIPIKIIVFNNGYLGLVREYQHKTYNAKYSMVSLQGSPDLSKIAEAYDMDYRCMENNKGMEEEIDSFLRQKGSAIMECKIDPLDVVKQV
ncbi:MAG: biosynthetic-type acetolactate synthase large subunit [Lachnospiraceae bacterium]|nr:biosynthetic-type acetolactate synthase large subunit [Lachnospiraceae bacterium]